MVPFPAAEEGSLGDGLRSGFAGGGALRNLLHQLRLHLLGAAVVDISVDDHAHGQQRRHRRHKAQQRRRADARQVVGALLVPLGFAAYCYINWRVAGNPFQFLIYQREHWNQRTGLFFSTAAYQTDYLLRCLRSGSWRDALGLWLPNLIACFAALGLLVAAAPKLRASQTAWFLAYYIVAVGATWLLSAPRYLLVLLPVPLALAQCAQKRTANIALTALGALAALGYLIAFALRWQVW